MWKSWPPKTVVKKVLRRRNRRHYGENSPGVHVTVRKKKDREHYERDSLRVQITAIQAVYWLLLLKQLWKICECWFIPNFAQKITGIMIPRYHDYLYVYWILREVRALFNKLLNDCKLCFHLWWSHLIDVPLTFVTEKNLLHTITRWLTFIGVFWQMWVLIHHF